MTDTMELIQTAVAREQERQDNAAFWKEADQPSLEKLSYILRHPETWPKDFEWYFPRCSQCAMGLARKIWKDNHDTMEDMFALSIRDIHKLFVAGPKRFWIIPSALFGNEYKSVTPEMIADRIDKYVAKRHRKEAAASRDLLL